jgi:hypothetical protein
MENRITIFIQENFVNLLNEIKMKLGFLLLDSSPFLTILKFPQKKFLFFFFKKKILKIKLENMWKIMGYYLNEY